MMNWNPYLSIESLIEACGEDHLDDITELEILFTSCTEIDSLQYCSSLTRLSMINNGLIVISNLYPVQETLKYLCLCDQQITRMENLHLPQLEKLYLYNNQIEEIRGLEHCTNLKILWLNQNQIRSISGLERCMYLEELQLHSNQIVNLNGIEAVRGSLSILGLADNLIATFDEIDKLQSMVALSEITFYDIHYGACPIYEQEGFREYTVLSLPNLQSLDGIRITPARVAAAQQTMEVHTNNMQIQLDKINAQYALDVTAVQVREKSEIDECIRIEESRRSELIDLSTRVSTYSQRISDEISRQENLFEHGLSKFSIASDHLLMESSEAVKSQQHNILHEYDRTASLVYILEYLETVRETMRNLLYQVSNTSNSNFKFEYVDRNTSKFHHFSQALSYNHTNINSPERPSIPVSFQNTINQKYNSAISPDVRLQNTHSNCQTELVHIYEINIRDCRKVTDQGVMTKIYTVLSFDQLYKFLSICHQGSEVSHLNELSDKSFVFFSNPDLAVSVMKSVSTTFPKPDTSHYWQSLQTSQARVTNEARTHTDIITPEIAPCLLDASRHNACIVLCCRVAVESVFGKKENLTRKLLFPASSSGRQDLLSEIYSTRKPLQLSVEAEEYDIIGKTNGSISSATNQIKKERMQTDLFILPLQQMHANLLSSNIIPNFVGITLSPTLNDGGFGSIESRIKAAMTHLCDIEQNNDIMLRLDLKLERKLQQFVRAMSGTESVESLSTSRSRQQVESTASTLRNFLRVSTVDPTSATAITTQSPLATSHSQNSSSKMHQKSVSSVRPKSRSRF